MRVKYNRTSTINQEGGRFDLDKSEYALTIFDKGVSGKIKFHQREGGAKLLTLVKEGKVSEVVVEEISRLGRNTIDVLSTLETLDNAEVNVVIRGMGNLSSRPNGKKSAIWGLITATMSALYEMERENILERTKAGRQAAVMNGVKMGRPSGANETRMRFMAKPKNLKILELLKKQRTYKEIKAITGCSESTISKVKKYSGMYAELKKQGVKENQLDLMIEAEKEEKKELNRSETNRNESVDEYLDKLADAIEASLPQHHSQKTRDIEVKDWSEVYAEMLKEQQKNG